VRVPLTYWAGSIGTGYAYAKIYEVTGTPGTDAIPTGDVIAVSNPFDIQNIIDAGVTFPTFSMFTLTFPGGTTVLAPNQTYALALEFTPSSPSSTNYFGWIHGTPISDTSNNTAYFDSSASDDWLDSAQSIEYPYYLYGEDVWAFTSKNSATWSNSSKNSATWSNSSKNSTTWTDVAKSDL